ncbi:MAG TPA: alpha/beta hydrolase [Spirochaetia bacterium]|nr:alpha/beta hydrolase [Spirochaetia bacterium]
MPDPVRPKDLTVSGKRVHLWLGGAGPALLLLHSAWGDAQMSWSPVWGELSRSFTVVAPDMPGYGASDTAEGRSLSESAKLLTGLLDSLGFDRAVVVGNSFGVALAIELASKYPGRVSNLVMVNGTRLPALSGFMKGIIRIPLIEGRFRRLMQTMSWSDSAFARGFPNQSALPVGFIDRIRGFKDKHARVGFDAVMGQAKPQSRPTVPVTLVWGTGDRLVSQRQMESFRQWLGRHEYVRLENAGHMPQLEMPKEFVAALLTLR